LSNEDRVKLSRSIAFIFVAACLLAVAARAQENSQPPSGPHFSDEDRVSMHAWYKLHKPELPVGVRKRDRLPADLEKRLVVHEVLPEDLRARIHPVSADLLGRVPPAPDGCEYVFIGGHAVLLDAKSYEVYDTYDFARNK
jgi:hypothetical protein